MRRAPGLALIMAIAAATVAPPSPASAQYAKNDRYQDHRWNPTNGGFAAGVANMPGTAPGNPAGSSYSYDTNQVTVAPGPPQQPPGSVPMQPQPAAPTGRWIGQLSGFYNSNGYAVFVQTVVCESTCPNPKPAATIYGTEYSDNFYCQTSDGHGSSAGFPPGGSRGFYTFPQCYTGYSF